MNDENILRAMRMQAWARAKAEIESVRATFFGIESASPGQFEDFDALATAFVAEVEYKSLHE